MQECRRFTSCSIIVPPLRLVNIREKDSLHFRSWDVDGLPLFQCIPRQFMDVLSFSSVGIVHGVDPKRELGEERQSDCRRV